MRKAGERLSKCSETNTLPTSSAIDLAVPAKLRLYSVSMHSQVVLATILLALCLLADARDLRIKLPARRALLGQLPP
jgi:hypothetical protein